MAKSAYLKSLFKDARKVLENRLHDRQSSKCFICEEPINLVLHDGQLDINHIDPLAEQAKSGTLVRK